MSAKSEVAICDTTANPAPLGLCAFGMTTVLLNLHNAGYFPLDSMILAMGIFYGGLAQVIAGYMEWKKKNTFATLAFTSYGFFWLTLVGLLVMPKLGWGEKPTEMAMAAYLAMWGFSPRYFSLALSASTGHSSSFSVHWSYSSSSWHTKMLPVHRSEPLSAMKVSSAVYLPSTPAWPRFLTKYTARPFCRSDRLRNKVTRNTVCKKGHDSSCPFFIFLPELTNLPLPLTP